MVKALFLKRKPLTAHEEVVFTFTLKSEKLLGHLCLSLHFHHCFLFEQGLDNEFLMRQHVFDSFSSTSESFKSHACQKPKIRDGERRLLQRIIPEMQRDSHERA